MKNQKFSPLNLHYTNTPKGKVDMTWLLIFSIFLISLSNALIAAPPAQAALPPLSTEELNQQATHIIVGKVKSISNREVSTDLGSNYEFTAIVEVKRVEKGLLTVELKHPNNPFVRLLGVAKPGAKIEVNYWLAGKRPDGWVGHGGQHFNLSANSQVRLFLTTEDGKLHLLEPNGWESL
jgi:hypothetical protein